MILRRHNVGHFFSIKYLLPIGGPGNLCMCVSYDFSSVLVLSPYHFRPINIGRLRSPKSPVLGGWEGAGNLGMCVSYVLVRCWF